MVLSCKQCGAAVLRLYSTDDGVLKDVCANCKAKYEHNKKIEEKKAQEPSEFVAINKRIDKMAQLMKTYDKRFFENETKSGNLEKRIEKIEEMLGGENE